MYSSLNLYLPIICCMEIVGKSKCVLLFCCVSSSMWLSNLIKTATVSGFWGPTGGYDVQSASNSHVSSPTCSSIYCSLFSASLRLHLPVFLFKDFRKLKSRVKLRGNNILNEVRYFNQYYYWHEYRYTVSL